MKWAEVALQNAHSRYVGWSYGDKPKPPPHFGGDTHSARLETGPWPKLRDEGIVERLPELREWREAALTEPSLGRFHRDRKNHESGTVAA